MKKSFTKLFGAIALAVSLLSAGSASATQITGSITLAGALLPEDSAGAATTLDVATQVEIDGSIVVQRSGDFLAAPVLLGTAATWVNPFVINPFPGGGITPLWTLATFGIKFDLLTMTINEQTSTDLDLSGTGILYLNGFDPTPGKFTFAATSSSSVTFGYSADQSAVVPEGGSAMALLGLGLMGIAGASRLKFAKA